MESGGDAGRGSVALNTAFFQRAFTAAGANAHPGKDWFFANLHDIVQALSAATPNNPVSRTYQNVVPMVHAFNCLLSFDAKRDGKRKLWFLSVFPVTYSIFDVNFEVNDQESNLFPDGLSAHRISFANNLLAQTATFTVITGHPTPPQSYNGGAENGVMALPGPAPPPPGGAGADASFSDLGATARATR